MNVSYCGGSGGIVDGIRVEKDHLDSNAQVATWARSSWKLLIAILLPRSTHLDQITVAMPLAD